MDAPQKQTGFLPLLRQVFACEVFSIHWQIFVFPLHFLYVYGMLFPEGSDMNHIGLYYFTVAAEELNITRAAAKLFISQQSLSEHIRKLEKQYDAVFFTRGGRLALTRQGERMLAYAREILEADRDLNIALRDMEQANRIRLHIGMASTRGNVFLPAIFEAYRKRCPNVVLSIRSGNFEYIEQQYLLEKIELYTGMTGNIRPRAPVDIFYRDKLYFIVSRGLLKRTLGGEAGDFIAASSHGIDVQDACRFPICLPPTTSTLRLILDRSFSKNDLHPTVVMETSDHDILFALCKRSQCGCFVSRELLHRKLLGEPHSENVLIFPANDFEDLSSFCMVYHRENLSPEAEALIACSHEVISDRLSSIDAELAAICAAQIRSVKA